MIIANHKPIRIIGYSESSMTQEFANEILLTHEVEIIQPDDFLLLPNQDDYQYIVAVSYDLEERKKIIEYVDHQQLDLITVISDKSLLGTTPAAVIHPGSFIFPFCNITLGASIGQHCIIGSYSLIGHYCHIGNNCIIRPGVMITNKSVIGDNCLFNIKSTVTNKVKIVDNVEVMAFTNITKDITIAGRYMGSRAKQING